MQERTVRGAAGRQGDVAGLPHTAGAASAGRQGDGGPARRGGRAPARSPHCSAHAQVASRPAPSRTIETRLLRTWPLPRPGHDGDKDDRGRVLIVGGARPMPGAVILAGTAALRAGAGKLQIATARTVAPLVGASVPESYVYDLPETSNGAIDPAAAAPLLTALDMADAVLIGPGMMNVQGVRALVAALLPHLTEATLVLDAAALACVEEREDCLRALGGRAVLTPHAGEMARCLGVSEEEVGRDPLAVARQAATCWGAVVALKGPQTYVAAPDGAVYRYDGGGVGLATSGSGDTLAGIIAGLAARGADPLHAAVWGVYLHGAAGVRLAQRLGPVGFLARELAAEIPSLLTVVEAEGGGADSQQSDGR